MRLTAETEWDATRWQDQAACNGCDPDLWFPQRGASTAAPKRVCRGCPVRVECFTYSMDQGEKFGIWGGLSERERRPHRVPWKRGIRLIPPVRIYADNGQEVAA